MKPTPLELAELMRLRGSALETYFAHQLEDVQAKLMNCNDADTVRQLQGAGRMLQDTLNHIRADRDGLRSVTPGKRL